MSMVSVIEKIIYKKFDGLWTLAPAKVTRVDADNMRVDLRIKNTLFGKNPINIRSAHVWYPRGGGSAILYPIAVGDIVLAAFSKIEMIPALADADYRTELDAQYFESRNCFVMGGFILDNERGTTVDGVELKIPDVLSFIGDISMSTPTFRGTTLPGASLTYRGQIRLVVGGGGSRDRLYMCMKSDGDTYSWVEIINGGA